MQVCCNRTGPNTFSSASMAKNCVPVRLAQRKDMFLFCVPTCNRQHAAVGQSMSSSCPVQTRLRMRHTSLSLR